MHFLSVILPFVAFTALAGASERGGTVAGTVRGRDDSVVAGASVELMRGGGALTDENGAFVFADMPAGRNMVYVSADGYSGYSSDYFEIHSGDTVVLDIRLRDKTVLVQSVSVTSSPIVAKQDAPVSMRRFVSRELTAMPGANLDVSKVVQAMPGVVPVSMAGRNDLLVRGGGANENRYVLDGIEIPVLNHFAVQGGSGGNASIVNTELLQSVDFYTSAFPVQYSNGLSSVLSMSMKTGNSERFGGKLTVGTSDAALIVDTPVSRNGKTTLIASYRRSYLDVLFRILKLPFLPVYNDCQFKISSKLSERDEVFVLVLGSFDRNRLNASLKIDDESRKYILGYLPANNQCSYVIGAGYRRRIKSGVIIATLSRNFFNNLLYKHLNNEKREPEILNLNTTEAEYRARFTAELWNVSGFRITVGAGVGYGRARNRFKKPAASRAGIATEVGKSRVGVWRYEAFAGAGRSFAGGKVSISASLRMEGIGYSALTSNPLGQLSPRIAIGIRPVEKLEINISAGRYYQEPSYTMLAYESGDGSWHQKQHLKYMAVNHYIAGIGFKATALSLLSLEVFYKQYSRMPVSMLDSLPVSTADFADYIVGDVPVKSVGKGRAYGLELSYRSFDLRSVAINLSYTLFRSKVDLYRRGESAPSPFDVGHILNVSAICDLGKGWSLGAKWHITGGYPYTPYDENMSSLVWAWDLRARPYHDYDAYNGMRSAPYHQLDLRAEKTWVLKDWKISVYADIQNVYDYKAEGQPILMPVRDKNGDYVPDLSNPGHYLMHSVPRDVGGTVLPTLGVCLSL